MYNLMSAIGGLKEELSMIGGYIDEYLHTDLEMGPVSDVLSAAGNNRGKMIRPILLLLSARFGPGYPAKRERICKLGAMVEIVHMASLIHDDIVDDSPLRRGRPTAQSRFGKDLAVYAGDFMLSRVMYHLFREEMGASGVILGQTIENMCRGELGQKACRWDTETTVDAYLKNIYGKTVALFVAACQLGAMESGCDELTVRRLSRIGKDLGYMFQMRDDLLDYLSDEQQEGKPVHKDFRDGIYTLPVLCTLGDLDRGPRLREIARQSVETPGYEELLEEMQELVCGGGGIQFTWEQIKNHAVQAKRQLSRLPHTAALGVIIKLIGWLTDSSSFSAVFVPNPK